MMPPSIEQIIAFMCEEGMILRGRELIATKVPSHGSCCTCQECGWDYDNCCCDHNRLLKFLMGEG